MAEDSTRFESDENVKGGRWNRLKNKLLSSRRGSDDDVHSSQNNDLDSFFRAGRPSNEGKRPLGPALDTSQVTRWPAMSEVVSCKDGEAADNLPPFQYHKPLRRRGLSVGFVVTSPEIIGEGGDESEEPAIAVAHGHKTLARVETFPSRLPPQVPPHRQLPAHADSSGGNYGAQPSELAGFALNDAAQALGHQQLRKPASDTTFHGEQLLKIQEKQELRWPSPDRRPQPSHVIVTDKLAHHSRPVDNITTQVGDPLSVLERARARSDAPMLRISTPDTKVQRPMREDSWHAISRMRAEEGKTLLRAGEPTATLRPGSSGSESAGSRSSSEGNRIPRKRVGSSSAANSRESSPQLGSRPSTADSSDPAILQLPRYPPALSSTLQQPTTSVPNFPRSKVRLNRNDRPQRPDHKTPTSSSASRLTSLGADSPYREQGSISTAFQQQPPSFPHDDTTGLHHLSVPNGIASSNTPSRSPSPRTFSAGEPARNTSLPDQSKMPSRGASLKVEKQCTFKCTLQAFSMSTHRDPKSSNQAFVYLPQWQRVQVLGSSDVAGDQESTQYSGPSVLVFDTQSSFTDSVIPLQHFRLDLQRPNVLQISCSPSHMRKLRVRSGKSDDQLAQRLKKASDVIRSQEFVQTWDFSDLSNMHAFQKAVTASDVIYDGLAHLLLPLEGHDIGSSHERQCIDGRIQILSKDDRVCLAAFLEDGQAVLAELPLKIRFGEPQVTDDLPAMRLIDTRLAYQAKVSLYDQQGYLPLNMKLVSGHKEDVTIGFDDEASKATFKATLLAI